MLTLKKCFVSKIWRNHVDSIEMEWRFYGDFVVKLIFPVLKEFSLFISLLMKAPGKCYFIIPYIYFLAKLLWTKTRGGGELVDFYDGGDHVRPFSLTPKYFDQIFQRPQIC